MNHSKRIFTSLALALILCLATAMGASAQVADLSVGENTILWNSLVPNKLVLHISGPAGDFTAEFEAGEKPAFDVFNKDGAFLQDGTYNWELIAVPVVSDEMKAARAAGERMVAPQGLKQSGTLGVSGGYFVLPQQEAANKPQQVGADKTVITDDLIVQGSACVGIDCNNGESFGFDTLRLKENNLRIKFQDTSSSASFPGNDWQITANESGNGGLNKFSIDDIDGGKTPFTVEAGAPNHSLYVDDAGNIGINKSTPVVEMHITDGDSPTIRLEQDGSSGFTPQTWDLAGNETNFFVRDVTNSSKLPFKIVPNAPTNSLYVASSGNIGLGDASPDAALNVERNDGSAQVLVEDSSTASGAVTLMNLVTTSTSGVTRPRFSMTHTNVATWNLDILNDGNFAFTRGGGGPVFTFEEVNGDFTAEGDITAASFVVGGQTLIVPDYVFEDDYELRTLEEVKSFIEAESHLPDVPSAAEINAGSLNMTDMQLTLLRKIEELTLYTLEQHDTIQELQTRLDSVEKGE